uniref:Calmodulin n=1 Tax=Aureoumbra lagunensis TaxID=44058 RepID=A0A7S3NM70_9STRA|mmetsp:Transcript_2042/g.2693  ORF Transcript_2042/g.2693 Transcript_2042/m.2693 type:complete len:152 (-) Transcript_2042:88-543(-)|eukprot:CAMPEP_0197286036 /NCGR_PEP_ID=MMETSP0890-20130614/1426_1 /TAXON_ID=44058 ORGANISM="Aureoumbra lagunensis, Strain CCMP1510" /NCGR_SAMPLE_ID=MMETSP0890 /ASSEMBLY_ACC=CAM_ASM_000533 /LENGTH=151 /DNA_ID=CAMNT_0042754039 /DNA_START=12 /DNA_END=467 /DNA_ORIENTATION=-
MSKGGGASLSAERAAELKEAWNLIAGDEKTQLTSKEVYKVYRALGMAPTEYEHKTYFKQMEPTNGKVDRADFLSTMEDIHVNSLANDKLTEAFEIFDLDKKQYFNQDDLARVMRNLGEDLTKDEIRDMILEVDCQGDLLINREEFTEMMAI